MIISNFSIRHNEAILVMCAGILLIGSYSYLSMPRESFPDVEFPYIIVTTFLDGANPSDIEKSVTIPLETELDSLEGLKEMRSTSLDSLSMVSLEFLPDVDTEKALNRTRDAVDRAQADLSQEAEEPVIKEFTVTSLPVVIYHLVGSGSVAVSELHDLAEKIESRLKLIQGVLDVDIYGGRDREIVIEVNPERLRFYNLSVAQIEGILRGTNRNVSAGTAENLSRRIVMRVPGEFDDPGEIMSLPVGATPSGTVIHLHDIASVRYDFEDKTSRSRLYDLTAARGDPGDKSYHRPRPSISLQITKRSGANILEMCRQIDEVLNRQPFPENIRIVKGLDQSKDVKMMISDLENGIGTSLILVLAVILIGLGAMNAVLVAAAIPFSMLLAITILKATGQTLNMMVLFSLILALGMLVDNAIVIIENIYRHFAMGVPRAKAAMIGTAEVAWPVITSTATTVGAFLPLVFWPGIIGKFMSFMPKTVIVVLTCSLFTALVINPTLAAIFMRIKPGIEREKTPANYQRPNYWLVTKYRKVLDFMLGHSKWTLCTALAALIFTFAVYAMFQAGTEFFPPVDPDTVTCSVSPPEGVSLTESDRLSRAMEDRIMGTPGSGYENPVQNIEHASVVVGLEGVGDTGGLQFGENNTGPINMHIEFVDRELRTERTTETLKEIRLRIAGRDKSGKQITHPLFGADFNAIRPQEGPPAGQPVSIDVFGKDLNLMSRVVTDLKRIMHSTPGTVKPTDNAVTAQPTLDWKVDRTKAGMLGLDQATVATALKIAVGGKESGTFGHGDAEQDIMLRLPERYRLDTERLRNVTVPAITGGAVPISSVASARLVPGPVTIQHYNKKRVLNVGAEVKPGIRNDTDIRNAFQEQVGKYPFPPGITYRFGGAAEEEDKAKAFLSKAFVASLFIILMVMVLQFNSLAVSGIVMCSVVLSLMGVLLGLMILRAPFGVIMTGIGVISLAGIVVNNAIVLLDAIQKFEKQGQSPMEAVITASMIRFRPVLLTAITTALGLLPMALKLTWNFKTFEWQYNTASSQWWQSMALTVIFGLAVATVLTLGVVPTLYLEYDRCRLAINRLRRK